MQETQNKITAQNTRCIQQSSASTDYEFQAFYLRSKKADRIGGCRRRPISEGTDHQDMQSESGQQQLSTPA